MKRRRLRLRVAAAADRGLHEDAVDEHAALDGVEHAIALADAVGHGARVHGGELRPGRVRYDERVLAFVHHHVGHVEERPRHELATIARVVAVLEGVGDGELAPADRGLDAVALGVESGGVAEVLREGRREVEGRIRAERERGVEVQRRHDGAERLPGADEAAVEEVAEDEPQRLQLVGHRPDLLRPVGRERVLSALAVDAVQPLRVPHHQDLDHRLLRSVFPPAPSHHGRY